MMQIEIKARMEGKFPGDYVWEVLGVWEVLDEKDAEKTCKEVSQLTGFSTKWRNIRKIKGEIK